MSTIKAFRKILDETFKVNFAKGNASSKLTDNKLNTYIELKENAPLIIDLGKTIKIDRALFQENISTGQRVEEGLLEYWDGKEWKTIQTFTTIGYKRLLRFKEVDASKFRFSILRAKATVQLAEIGFFKASKSE